MKPDPCPRCGRGDGDPSRNVVVAVRRALERQEEAFAEAQGRFKDELQEALFHADDTEDDHG